MDKSDPYQDRFSLALLLPRCVVIAQTALIGSFSIMIVGVIGLMHFTNSPNNPFAVYADIFPGQPPDALAAHGFTCTTYDYSYHREPSEFQCVLLAGDEAFSHIEVIHTYGVIRLIHFDMRENTINVGEMVMMLDLSAIRSHGRTFFKWRGHTSDAVLANPTEHFSVFHAVGRITLTNSP